MSEHGPLLLAYLRDELDDEARRRVSDALIDHPALQREFTELKELHEFLGVMPTMEPSAGFAASVMDGAREIMLAETQADLVLEEMEEMAEFRPDYTPPPSLTPWALVGTLLVTMGSVLAWWPEPDQPAIPEDPVPLVFVQPEPDREPEPAEEATIPEAPLPEVTEELIAEHVDIGQDIDEETVGELPLPEVPDPDPEPVVEIKTTEKIPAVVDPEPAPEDPGIERVGTYGDETPTAPKIEPHWALPLLSADGRVGQGDDASVSLNALLLAIEGTDRKAGVPQPHFEKVIDFIDSVPVEEGMSKSLYHHAVYTYNLAVLVSTGRKDFVTHLAYATKHLVDEQNADGGWGYYGGRDRSASNALVSGWAALALHDASKLGVPKLDRAVRKARKFFHRLTDPRGAECGFFARGDNREPHLCSVMSTLVQLTGRDAKKIPRTIERTEAWVKLGLARQKTQIRKFVDYDFLIMSRRFTRETKGDWTKSLGDLAGPGTLERGPARWGGWSSVTLRLFATRIRRP